MNDYMPSQTAIAVSRIFADSFTQAN